MPEVETKCRECGTEHPELLAPAQEWEGEYPPETVETICGTKWDGCSDVTTHDVLGFVDPTETCVNCGAVDFLVPVWEDMEDYQNDENPDFIGCTVCNQMRPLHANDA